MKLKEKSINLGKISKSDNARFKIELEDYNKDQFHYYKTDCSCTLMDKVDLENGVFEGYVVGRVAGEGELEKIIQFYENPNMPYYIPDTNGKMVVNKLKKKHTLYVYLEVEG